MTDLSPRMRREMRARAHHLQPVVLIGESGLTPEVLREIEVHLRSHELVKIRAPGEADRASRDALAAAVCSETGAQPVQQIGRILVIYRARPPDEVERTPRRRHRRPARRTKRSFQVQ